MNSTIRIVAVLGVGSAMLLGWGCARPAAPDPRLDSRTAEILSKMSERLAAAECLKIVAERAIDPELRPEGEVMSNAEVTAVIARPNRFTATARGGGAERHIFYDGKTFVLHDVVPNIYGVAALQGDLDAAFDRMEERLGIDPPLADFLRADPNTALLEFVTAGKYMGEETVDGAARHHLHFTEEAMEWDLWVTSADFLPHRLVIHATALEGSPEARVDFRSFDLEAKTGPDGFAFTPDADAILVEMMKSQDLE